MEPIELIRRLADGDAHSGEGLARDFGVSRAAVWKQMAKLKEWDLTVHAVPGRGYRLSRPIDLLDANALAELCAAGPVPIDRIEVFTELASTNRYLLGRPAPRAGAVNACLAEYQSAGRGRRGRSWSAPFGGGLCLSVGWQFSETPADLSALTLAAGVIVKRVLSAAHAVDVSLKWPNDLVWDDRKLGGILVELTAEAQGGCHVVIGVGINVSIGGDVLAKVSDWARGAVDLSQASRKVSLRRVSLAAELIRGMAMLLADYPRTGFAPYHSEWLAADYLGGKPVSLGGGAADGVARGIDVNGALCVEAADGSLRRIISGDVSVRPVA